MEGDAGRTAEGGADPGGGAAVIEKVIPDIPKIHAYWNRSNSRIPYLMVPMSDGTVIKYYPRTEQTAFRKALESIRNLKTMAGKEE